VVATVKGVEFSPRMRRKINERDDERCTRCGRPVGPSANIHHRKLRSRGGMGNAANGILLCGTGTTGCHGWAHANVTQATEEGLIVSRWADPVIIPILTWRGWIRVDDDGGWTLAA
jgi:hypothetical protein